MKARRYCIVYLTETLGQKAEQHGYSDTGSILNDIQQIIENGGEIVDVFQLPDGEEKTAAEATVSVDEIIDYLSQTGQELQPEQSAKAKQ